MTQQVATTEKPESDQVFRAIGLLTRMLHDALRELGVNNGLHEAMHSIPDAKARMEYIGKMSGEAADKVISQVEAGKSRQQALAKLADGAELALKKDPVQAVATGGVLQFIEKVRASSHDTDKLFTEILLAQSFHDLTTQAMGKVLATTTKLEQELVKLLVEVSPHDAPAAPRVAAGPTGPSIDKTDPGVVTSQSQVDDLLESLGF